MTAPIVVFLDERLDNYLDDLRQLAGTDSGSTDKEGVDAINDWLEGRLGTLGLTVERFAQEQAGDDLLATLDGSGRWRILLLGHSDTVFAKGTAAGRPVTIQGGRGLGPGPRARKA